MRRVYSGYRTILATNVAQPLVFTTTTAAILAGLSSPNIVPVVDGSIFDQGTWCIVDTPGGGGEERAFIFSVVGNTLKLQVPGGQGDIIGCQKAHASGVIIRPSRMCSKLSVQSKDGNTAAAALFLGNSAAAKTDGTATFWKLVNVAANQQPPAYEESLLSGSSDNGIDSGEYWIVGTNPDQYLVSIMAC